MRLYLHPGLHKTGTTSFQRLLDRNKERFPTSFEAYNQQSPEFERISADIISFHKRPTEEKLNVVRNQLITLRAGCLERGCENLLLSNENILGLMPRFDRQMDVYMHRQPIIQTFIEVFGAKTITIFLTTREFDSWLDSVYRHQVKARGIRIPVDKFAALPKFQKMGSMESFVAEFREQTGQGIKVVTSALEDQTDGPGPHMSLLQVIDPTCKLFNGWQSVRRHNVGLGTAEMSKIKSPLLSLAPNFLLRRYARHLLRKRGRSNGT